MSTDLDTLVAAIEGLKPTTDYFKEYVMPIITIFVSTGISAWLAYKIAKYSNENAERFKFEKQKITIANTFILQAESCLQNLISIKQNYVTRLTNNPFQRMNEFPAIVITNKKRQNLNIADLVFLNSNSKDDKSQWSQINLINLMFENYDTAIDLLERRSLKKEELNRRLLEHVDPSQMVGFSDVRKVIDDQSFTFLIQTTEQLIVLVDDLMLMLNDFLIEFPKLVSKKVDRELIGEGFPGLLTFPKNENEHRRQFFERSPTADYSTIAGLIGLSVDELNRAFQPSYPIST